MHAYRRYILLVYTRIDFSVAFLCRLQGMGIGFGKATFDVHQMQIGK